MELEGRWGWMLVFSSGLMVLFHLRASTGGFRCALPGGLDAGWDSLEPDYLRLNPLENPLRVDLRPVPPGVCLPWCCGCHEGVCGHAGAFLRYSRGVAGLWTARSLFSMAPRDRGRKKSSRVELLPGARFGISVEPSAAAWWGEISWFPDHPGGPQVFSLVLLGFQPRKGRCPED